MCNNSKTNLVRIDSGEQSEVMTDSTILFKARKSRRMIPKKPLAICLYLFGTSLFLFISGILLLCLWPLLHSYVLSSNFVLKPSSATYDLWKTNPLPMTLKLHLFNWTNAKEVVENKGTVKPRFAQLGPYTFVETKEKVNITWNANSTVTFKHLKKWWFDTAASNGSLMDPVTSISPVALSATYSARNWNYIVKKGLNVMLPTLVDSIYSTHTVGQTLFDGYTDPIMEMANKMPTFFQDKSGPPPMDRFGWFYGRNGSEDFEGTFNMDTGVHGRLGQLYSWKYERHTPYYPDHCGEVGGSAGEFFPTDLTKKSVIKFFSADLCRYAELEFEKEVVVHGILGYKYAAGDRFLDNGTKIPENKCFCQGECMPSGALNVSACRYGSPAFVSLPHFYKADPYYVNLMEGVEPLEERDEFFMIFEPKTGLPLKVAARLQLNLLLQPVDGIRFYENVPKVYIPVLWFEQVVSVPADMAFYIKLLLNFKVICLSIGIILICFGLLIQFCLCYKICTTKIFGKKRKSRSLEKQEVPLKQDISLDR